MEEIVIDHLCCLHPDDMLALALALAEAAGTKVDESGRATLEGLTRLQVFEARAGVVSFAGRHEVLCTRDDEIDRYWLEARVDVPGGTVAIAATETRIRSIMGEQLAEATHVFFERLCTRDAVWRTHVTVPAAWDQRARALGLQGPGCVRRPHVAQTSYVYHPAGDAFFAVQVTQAARPHLLAAFGPWPSPSLPTFVSDPPITPIAGEPNLAAVLAEIAPGVAIVVEHDAPLATIDSASVELEGLHDRPSLRVTEGRATRLRAGDFVLRSVACTASTRFGVLVVQHEHGSPLGLIVRWWLREGSYESYVRADGLEAALARSIFVR